MAYFERISETTFFPTAHTTGAWNTKELHIAPVMGLLAHVLESECARRGTGFAIARLSYDILGTIPAEALDTSVRVLRPGRTIELVEATLSCRERPALRLQAWLMLPGQTQDMAGSPLPPIAPHEDMPAWDATSLWPGGFIASIDVRRDSLAPGRASCWIRPQRPLLAGEPVSPLARAAGLFDVANGMAVRADPNEVTFPNLDLTAHLFRPPQGEWLGFDTSVSFGAQGMGLTSTVLHDAQGPIGTIAQTLTIRKKS